MHPVLDRIRKRIAKGIGLVRLTRDHTWVARFASLFPSWGSACRRIWGRVVPGALAVVLLTFAWVTVPQTTTPLWEVVSRQTETSSPFRRDMLGWTVLAPIIGSGDSADDTWVYYVDPESDGTGATGYQAGEAIAGSDPLNPSGTPNTYATIQAALDAASSRNQNDASNWILVKRGTTATDSSTLSWKLTGPNATAPALLASYGTGARPVVEVGLQMSGGGGAGAQNYHDIAIVGIHFYDPLKDPDGAGWAGYPTHATHSISVLVVNGAYPVTDSILIEDCRVEFMAVNLQSGFSGGFATNSQIRRSALGPNYKTTADSHQQALFTSYQSGLLVEDSVLYYGGWYDHPTLVASPETSHQPDIFVRNAYLANSPGAVFRNVLSVKSASTSAQYRCGATDEYCVHSHNPMGILFGSSENDADMSESFVRDSCVIDNTQNGVSSSEAAVIIARSEYVSNATTAEGNNFTITGSIFARNPSATRAAMQIKPATSTYDGYATLVSGNIVYDWNDSGTEGNIVIDTAGSGITVTLTGNDIQEPTNACPIIQLDEAYDAGVHSFGSGRYDTQQAAASWFDNNGTDQTLAAWATATSDDSTATAVSYTAPTRGIESYHSSIGGSGDLDTFMALALGNNREDGWDWRYTAYSVNDHVREGFDLDPVSGGNVSSAYLAYRDGSNYLGLSAGGSFLVLGT